MQNEKLNECWVKHGGTTYNPEEKLNHHLMKSYKMTLASHHLNKFLIL